VSGVDVIGVCGCVRCGCDRSVCGCVRCGCDRSEVDGHGPLIATLRQPCRLHPYGRQKPRRSLVDRDER